MQPWLAKPYQKKAVRCLLGQPEMGLLLDPGLGKTSIALAALKVLKMRALVVAPLRVCYEVWPAEIQKWAEFQGLRVELLHGSSKERALRREADIYLVNPEGLSWFAARIGAMQRRPEVLIIDESTKFKNTQTLRFKLLKPLLPTFQRRIILTGTPVPNGLLDIFGQVFILDLGHSLGAYITHYRNNFFHQSGFGGYTWTINDGAEEQIYERVRPITLRLAAEDYLTMPKRFDTQLTASLPEDAARQYTDLEEKYILARTPEDPVTVENAAVLSMKLRQVCGGFVYTDSGKVQLIHDAKVDILRDLVEELSGQPTLVAYQFDHEGAALAEIFRAPRLCGGVTPRRMRVLLEEWNAGQLPVLFIHPQTMGHGLNLQRGGRSLIWYSLPWSQEDYDQTFRRLWRQGQEKPVHQYHLIFRDTVDELVLASLIAKESVQKKFLDAMKTKGGSNAVRTGHAR